MLLIKYKLIVNLVATVIKETLLHGISYDQWALAPPSVRNIVLQRESHDCHIPIMSAKHFVFLLIFEQR